MKDKLGVGECMVYETLGKSILRNCILLIVLDRDIFIYLFIYLLGVIWPLIE